MTVMRDMMVKLKLTVNETKTRRCRGPDEPFHFLGYPTGRLYSPRTGWADIGVRPSDRSLQKLKLRAQTDRRWGWRDDVRFDEGEVETESWQDTRAPATERAGQHARLPYATAPPLDSTEFVS